MEERSTARGFLIGLLAGGAIGSIAALLYAPKSGKELRKDIRKKSREIADDTEHYLETAKTKASEIITDGRKKAEELIRDARTKANNIVTQGKDYVNEETTKIKDAFRAGVDSFKDERKHGKAH